MIAAASGPIRVNDAELGALGVASALEEIAGALSVCE